MATRSTGETDIPAPVSMFTKLFKLNKCSFCSKILNGTHYDSYTFEEKIEMLLEAESSARRDRKIAKLVKQARFKLPAACVEDILYLPQRNLTKDRVNRLRTNAHGCAIARSWR